MLRCTKTPYLSAKSRYRRSEDMENRFPSQAAGESRDACWTPWAPLDTLSPLQEYCIDAWQRSILLLDVLRQRGNNCVEHNARKVPNVLSFDFERVLDGRSLPRPVNYGLVRIIPPKDTSIDP